MVHVHIPVNQETLAETDDFNTENERMGEWLAKSNSNNNNNINNNNNDNNNNTTTTTTTTITTTTTTTAKPKM